MRLECVKLMTYFSYTLWVSYLFCQVLHFIIVSANAKFEDFHFYGSKRNSGREVNEREPGKGPSVGGVAEWW